MLLEAIASKSTVQAYLAYLCELASSRSVYAAEDLFDEDGETVFYAGGNFAEIKAEDLSSVVFVKPIDEVVKVDSLITPEQLYIKIYDTVLSEPSIAALGNTCPIEGVVRDCCAFLLGFSSVQQKLTVMSECLPQLFEQSLFTAWFGVLAVEFSKRSSQDANTIFCAAICHDIGMLNVAPAVVNKAGDLSHAEWGEIQEHPLLGWEILNQVPKFPKEIAHAVREHHENLDGTGYPNGIVGSMISRHGQLLGLLDCLNKVYTKRYRQGGRSIRDMIPFIRMNGHARFGNAGKKFIELLSVLPESDQHSIPEALMSPFLNSLRERHAYIVESVAILQDIAGKVGFRHNVHEIFALQNAIIHISVSVSQTGTINPAYMRWLDQVESESLFHAYKEAEDVYLMMHEVMYHLRTLKRKISGYLAYSGTAEHGEVLQDGLDQLNALKVPVVEEVLKELWLTRVD